MSSGNSGDSDPPTEDLSAMIAASEARSRAFAEVLADSVAQAATTLTQNTPAANDERETPSAVAELLSLVNRGRRYACPLEGEQEKD